MDTIKFKEQILGEMDKHPECIRAVDVLGDSIDQLLKEGVKPYDIAHVLLSGTIETLCLDENPQAIFCFGTMMHFLAENVKEVARTRDPNVTDWEANDNPS